MISVARHLVRCIFMMYSTAKTISSYFGNRRRILNFLVCFFSLCASVLVYLLIHLSNHLVKLNKEDETHETNNRSRRIYVPYNSYGFYPVNDKGIYSFWNVCIEALPQPIRRETDYLGEKLNFNETQRIVVYNSFYREGPQKAYVSGSHNSAWNNWDIIFLRRPIPPTHSFEKRTAFFIAQTCPANFHHFWIDEFVPLYCVVKQGNRLKPDSDNQILYHLPTDLTEASVRGCYNKTTFEDILKTLYINPFHDAFFNVPTNTCFSSAVFGSAAVLINPRAVVDHVLAVLKQKDCHKNANYVTFIQRTHRRIVNIDDLVTGAKSLGMRNVRVVNYETLNVQEQVRISATSRIFVGVQGAGLQWAIFMPPGSSLIEIGWPYKYWGFYFENYVTQYKIRHHRLYAHYVHVNWTSYETMVRQGRHVDVDERLQLLQQPPKTGSLDNIWKWADAFVKVEDFLEILTSIDASNL